VFFLLSTGPLVKNPNLVSVSASNVMKIRSGKKIKITTGTGGEVGFGSGL
jgi:hypothetical protein